MQPPERRSLHGVCLWLLLALSGGTDVENVCEKGFYQEDPIVFGCQGGKGRQSMILTSRAAAQGQFSWEVPKDTADLSVEVLFEPLKSLHGSAKLSAKCADTGEVILGETQSLLNESAKLVTAHGAQWSWSGNATHRSGSFSLWLRVHGPLHCDLGFRVENDLESNLAADVRYSWSHIKPCPKQLKGCEECPKDKCHPDDVAVCDGSRYWECLPKEALLKRTSTTEGETTHSTTTSTTPQPSLDELMEDPHFQQLLQQEEELHQPEMATGPLPTSHPAVTLRKGWKLQPSRSPVVAPMGQDGVHWQTWGIGFIACVLLLASCVCCCSAEPSQQVRGQVGTAIQGQRTPYYPIEADPGV
ncbi:unnamed protein product [Durusdinium trenchii]|uniref:Chloroplastic n=3 Tax=Durusdinium trenchii TaxID=1381693 RepID=A0ABP0N0Q2_9DINO